MEKWKFIRIKRIFWNFETFNVFLKFKILTLNSEKSTLISLLEGWFVDDADDELTVEFDANEDIDDSPPSSDFLQMSSSFAAFDVPDVGGTTEIRRKIM
jgi:hypothetical protein